MPREKMWKVKLSCPHATNVPSEVFTLTEPPPTTLFIEDEDSMYEFRRTVVKDDVTHYEYVNSHYARCYSLLSVQMRARLKLGMEDYDDNDSGAVR